MLLHKRLLLWRKFPIFSDGKIFIIFVFAFLPSAKIHPKHVKLFKALKPNREEATHLALKLAVHFKATLHDLKTGKAQQINH
jgi:hypothetical protein